MATTRKAALSATRKYRDRMRALGLRQVNLWLPDTRSPEFAKECRRQSKLAARQPTDKGVDALLDEALNEIDGWKR
jgi:hypothetical protein